MEARDLLSGDYDVVVCDGFWGNVALKSCEGTAQMLMKLLKKEIMSGFFSKIAGAMLKKKFKKLQTVMDYNAGGGAPFIGVEKLVIKSHGSSKAKSICGSIMQVVNMHKAGLVDKIKRSFMRQSENNLQIREIERKIGYEFSDKNLLATAFTHSSYANEKKLSSNENMEFSATRYWNF